MINNAWKAAVTKEPISKLCDPEESECSTNVLGLLTNLEGETLHLQHNKINDIGAHALGQALNENTALQTLCLQYNEIHDAGVL
mmetsp:Transcript_39107/g.90678  ORF Transcript_39107/g.90678 Transcript_39107/m.90678 type:complete len:84 (-) Transcript_39107:203-454(-)